MNDSDTKSRLYELIPRLFDFELSEEEQDLVHQEISTISPDPYWSDYIFHSDKYHDKNGKIDLDQLIDKIISYKPIIL